MRIHTREEVSMAVEWVESQNFPREEKIITPEVKLNYFVMPRTVCPDLPNFVWQCLTMEGEELYGVYGISEETPEEFRPYPILHEQLEADKVLSGKSSDCSDDSACLSATIVEVRSVPERIMPKYIPFRRDFFRGLVKYAKNHGYDSDDIAGFRKSLGFLEKLARLL